MSASSITKFLLLGILILSTINASFWLVMNNGRSPAPAALNKHLLDFLTGGGKNNSFTSNSSQITQDSIVPLNISSIPFRKSFSACLLIKDDNDILNEWLAYHYYALNLRYLVVAHDPSSHTSPQSIFDKWRNHTNFQIVSWTDRDYMPDRFLQEEATVIRKRLIKRQTWNHGHEDPETIKANNLRVSNHRFRQLTFLSACLKHMRNQKRTLVAHIDTDEYIVLNPKLRTRDVYREYPLPTLQQPGAIANFVQNILYRHEDLFDQANFPCLSMPRLLFGSVENPTDDEPPQDVVLGHFNRTSFETLRWLYHASYMDSERNAQPKVIVDVSMVPLKDQMFSGRPFSIHRPSKTLCRWLGQMELTGFQRYPLIVHHYLGTWERYMARNDSRRSARLYDSKANVQSGKDEWIGTWLDGFVRAVGVSKARILLDRHVV